MKTIWHRWLKVRWWVRWMSCAVTLVVGFYVVEDIRGYLALERAKKAYLAAGYRLGLDEIRGPLLDEEENFALSEILTTNPFADSQLAFDAMSEVQRLVRIPWNEPVELNGFHGPLAGLDSYLEKEADLEESYRLLDDNLPVLKGYFQLIHSMCERTSCDWLVWIEFDDWVNSSTPDSNLGMAEFALRVQTLLEGAEDPSLALKNTKALFRMAEFKPPFYSRGRSANPFFDSGTSLVAWGLRERLWSDGELAELAESAERAYAQHTWANRIELLIGGFFLAEFEDPVRSRRLFRDFVSSGEGFFRLPDEILLWETDELNKFLNRMVVALMPRGWVWQNQASIMEWIVKPEVVTKRSLYKVFVVSGASMVEEFEAVRNERIRSQLMSLAIEAERFFAREGRYPSKEEMESIPEQVAFQMDANGRPVFWYFDGVPPKEVSDIDLEIMDHDHVWRYPVPSN